MGGVFGWRGACFAKRVLQCAERIAPWWASRVECALVCPYCRRCWVRPRVLRPTISTASVDSMLPPLACEWHMSRCRDIHSGVQIVTIFVGATYYRRRNLTAPVHCEVDLWMAHARLWARVVGLSSAAEAQTFWYDPSSMHHGKCIRPGALHIALYSHGVVARCAKINGT